MWYKIQKRIAKRLLIVWLVLSFLIGIAVFFLELQRVKELVVLTATSEAGKLSDPYHSLFHQRDRDTLNLVAENFSAEFSRSHFVLAEMYSQEKELLFRQTVPEMADRVGALEAGSHETLMTDKAGYKWFFDNGELFLKIMVPIHDIEDRLIIGYFEGVYLVDPGTMSEIRSRIITSVLLVFPVVFALTLAIYPIIINLISDLMKLSRELSDANLGLLVVLGGAVAKRDSETNAHNYRVAIYAILLGEQMRIDDDGMQSLIKGAFLHDLGKVAIRDKVLHKPGELTNEESEEMRSHVRHGVEILEKYSWFNDALDIVGHHHEKYDGSGYPSGRIGDDIPLLTRIFSIVDVFDALTSERPYKDAFPIGEAVQVLREGRGRHFDPQILDNFLRICGPLHAELGSADDEYLHSRMSALVSRYFHDV